MIAYILLYLAIAIVAGGIMEDNTRADPFFLCVLGLFWPILLLFTLGKFIQRVIDNE